MSNHDLMREEVASRRAALAERLSGHADGVILFMDPFVSYMSGFLFVPTERPIVYVDDGASTTLVVPFLEGEHARQAGFADHVETYDEYPGGEHALKVLARLLATDGLAAASTRIAVDTDGYPPVWGYDGPSLSELIPAKLVRAARDLDCVMMVKSEYEVERLRQSSLWASRAHSLLQEFTRAGLRETEVSNRASAQATDELVRAEPGYVAGSSQPGARAGYRGQIGRRGALPHSMGANIRFAVGDTLVTGATAPMWGYVSELERTMFLGEPVATQRTLFAHMKNLQDLCISAVRPGVTAASVDLAMRNYFEACDLWPLWRHHVGHGIGRRYHEAPFLDRGDDTVLAPGMILTIEPGLYHTEWGGFRHSDTLVVTDTGSELLTEYPRDIDALVIPA